jgi:hypothetical protein
VTVRQTSAGFRPTNEGASEASPIESKKTHDHHLQTDHTVRNEVTTSA